METLELKRIGVDDWSRPVYIDNNGKLWKDINCDLWKKNCIRFPIELYSAYNNEFFGEPDMPISNEYNINI